MSQYIDLTLDGKTRRFRFTPFDARNVCRLLNNLAGYTTQGPVTPNQLRTFLAGRDLDTWAAVLSEGLKHEDDRMTHDKAMKLLTEYLGEGGDIVPVAKAIVKAGEISGVWEKPDQEGNSAGATTAS